MKKISLSHKTKGHFINKYFEINYIRYMSASLLEKPIEYLIGVVPNRVTLLRNELGIDTCKDLLYHFPNRYVDRTRFYNIAELPKLQADVQLIGKITDIRLINQSKGKRLVANFQDATGEIELIWFRGYQWIQKQLQLNIDYQQAF